MLPEFTLNLEPLNFEPKSNHFPFAALKYTAS